MLRPAHPGLIALAGATLGVNALIVLSCFPDPKLLDALDAASRQDVLRESDGSVTDAEGAECAGDSDCATQAAACVAATCENGT